MPTEEPYDHHQDRPDEHSSFDALARAVADSSLSRSKAVKLVGAAILAGAFSFLGLPAEAKKKKRRKKHRAPVPPPAALRPPVASDCSEDVTEAFNDWLANVGDGSTIYLAPNGCYQSNGTILFENKRNITILGNGATIKASGEPDCFYDWTPNEQGYCVIPRNPDGTCPGSGVTFTEIDGECIGRTNRAQLRFNVGGDIVVRDLTVQGSNFSTNALTCATNKGVGPACYDPIREADGNIQVFGSDGILIHNVHFKNAWGDALQLSPGGTWDGDGNGASIPQNVTVQQSTVDTAGRHGFTSNAVRNFIARDNKITNVGYWGIDIEVEATTWTADLTAERNTFSNLYVGMVSVSPHIHPSTLGPLVVRDNVRTDPPVYCSWGMLLLNSNTPNMPNPPSVTVTGNYVPGSAGGISVGPTPQANVTGNTVEIFSDIPYPCAGNALAGIYFWHVSSGSIVGNTVLNVEPFYVVNPESPRVTVCGNRTTPTGAFDQPQPC